MQTDLNGAQTVVLALSQAASPQTRPTRARRSLALLLALALVGGCDQERITAPSSNVPQKPSYVLVEPGTVAQVSAGDSHGCALRTDSTVVCWGNNSDLQATPPPGTFVQISAGGTHSCGIRRYGKVVCWGTWENRGAPGTFKQVSAGDRHTCGVRTDGRLHCWGYNIYSPVPTGTFAQVSAGSSHTCAVRTDGSVACWGVNSYGQVTAPAGTFSQVSAGTYHSCGVRTDATAACWGNNWYGQATPPAGTFSQVSAGRYRTCGVRTNGTVACWGSGYLEQLVPPTGTFSHVSAGRDYTCGVRTEGTLVCWPPIDPVMVLTARFSQVSITTGFAVEHVCAVRLDGSVGCWGENFYGQATPPPGTFSQVSVGYQHSCGVRTDGTLACWGKAPGAPPTGTFSQVSAKLIDCAVRTEGTIACWGENEYRSLGPPPTGTFRHVALSEGSACGLRTDGTLACWHGQATSPTGTFSQIAAGEGHFCGVRTEGTVACWGDNQRGQATPPTGTFVQVSAGSWHTCGVRTNGTLACWGQETSEHLVTPPAGMFVQVSSGARQSCAIAADHSLACWGHTSIAESSPDTNHAPNVLAGGPYQGQEAAELSIALTATDPDGDLLTVTWDFGDGSSGSTEVGGALPTRHVYADNGHYVLTLTAGDGEAAPVTQTAIVTIDNVAPTASWSAPTPVAEGGAYTLALSNPSDPSPIDRAAGFAYAFDCGTGYGAFGASSSVSCSAPDNGSFLVRGAIRDKDGGETEYAGTATVTNVAPTLSAISAPTSAVSVGTAFALSATFTDPGIADTHTARIDWGDGAVAAGTIGGTNTSGTVRASHAYSTPGLYRIQMTVTDKDGGVSNASVFEYAVVYDPSAGFVTGGGWITSPPGSYTADPGLEGQATFEFVAKYLKGTMTPRGNTEFRLGTLAFSSTSYDWLVVAEGRAEFRGVGTVNGQGNFGFLLTAIDSRVHGGGRTDAFRIKIWDRNTGQVIYDNQPGAGDQSDRATVIGGGSIVIHR